VGCLLAANYRYVMEYGFHDDGTVTFRMGSTATTSARPDAGAHAQRPVARRCQPGRPVNSVYTVEHIDLSATSRTRRSRPRRW